MRDEPEEETIVWFDIFSINQHKPTQWTFDWLSTAFMSAIKSFGRTVVVLSPWHSPLPFRRLWCIYEAYSTLFTDGKFEIAMSERDQSQFLQDVRADPERRINQMLGTIRAEKAECYLDEDRDNIVSVIQRSVGFGRINAMVFEKYRDWVLLVSLDAYNKCCDEKDNDRKKEEKLEILGTIGALYSGQGKHQQAEPYLKECFIQRQKLLGETHSDTLIAMDRFAVHCTVVGRYNEGRKLHTDCLSKRVSLNGGNNPGTLQSMHNLAYLHQCQGNFESAQTMYKDCLSRRREFLGNQHPDTIDTLNHLASLLVVRGRYGSAEPLYEECLFQRKKKWGKTNPDTLTSIHNLAR